jgi:uncharacterized protein (AIM24 family)
LTLDVQLVGTTTQMAIVTLNPGQVVYSESGKFLFGSGDIRMETKLSAPGDESGGGVGGLLRGAMQAGRRMMTGESLAVTHFSTMGGDGLLAFAGVIPGEMRAIQLSPGETWYAEKDAFVAAEAGVHQSIEFAGFGRGLMGARASCFRSSPDGAHCSSAARATSSTSTPPNTAVSSKSTPAASWRGIRTSPMA